MSRTLGLPLRQVEEIAIAGHLHDIGKLAVPSDLLRKAGSLTRREYRQIMLHTVLGANILEPLFASNTTVQGVVRWHHERVDGSGLLDGLQGEEIPLAARIVCVADAFDAMTTARPYRTALSLEVALLELTNNVGTQFDRRCVDAVASIFTARSAGRARLKHGEWQHTTWPVKYSRTAPVDSVNARAAEDARAYKLPFRVESLPARTWAA